LAAAGRAVGLAMRRRAWHAPGRGVVRGSVGWRGRKWVVGPDRAVMGGTGRGRGERGRRGRADAAGAPRGGVLVCDRGGQASAGERARSGLMLAPASQPASLVWSAVDVAESRCAGRWAWDRVCGPWWRIRVVWRCVGTVISGGVGTNGLKARGCSGALDWHSTTLHFQ
jgi:hypothetical protein